MDRTSLPRILLIEDNPISREFLHDALLPLSVVVDVADTLAHAVTLADQHAYSLFLCDVHLPDAGPAEILHALQQRQKATLTVAVTAGIGTEVSRKLLDLGYREVWYKPIAMAALQENVARLLDLPEILVGKGPFELWDEASALRAVGNNRKTLDALRQMFIEELPRQITGMENFFAEKNLAGLKAECHKLLANCGFVGAANLALATRRLSEQPDEHQNLVKLASQARAYLMRH